MAYIPAHEPHFYLQIKIPANTKLEPFAESYRDSMNVKYNEEGTAFRMVNKDFGSVEGELSRNAFGQKKWTVSGTTKVDGLKDQWSFDENDKWKFSGKMEAEQVVNEMAKRYAARFLDMTFENKYETLLAEYMDFGEDGVEIEAAQLVIDDQAIDLMDNEPG